MSDSPKRCEHGWHTLPESWRSPRCPSCREVHPWGILEGVEYLKMLRGEAFTTTFRDDRKEANMSAGEFLKKLAFEEGASIVCTASLTPDEINRYREEGRMFVDEDGYGYVIKPSPLEWIPAKELARLEDQPKGEVMGYREASAEDIRDRVAHLVTAESKLAAAEELARAAEEHSSRHSIAGETCDCGLCKALSTFRETK